MQETLGSNDDAASSIDVGLRGDAIDTTEVVGVRVGVDHCNDRSRAELVVRQVE